MVASAYCGASPQQRSVREWKTAYRAIETQLTRKNSDGLAKRLSPGYKEVLSRQVVNSWKLSSWDDVSPGDQTPSRSAKILWNSLKVKRVRAGRNSAKVWFVWGYRYNEPTPSTDESDATFGEGGAVVGDSLEHRIKVHQTGVDFWHKSRLGWKLVRTEYYEKHRDVWTRMRDDALAVGENYLKRHAPIGSKK